MNLKEFFNALPDETAREAFAAKCETSVRYMRNVMYGVRPCSPKLAVAIELHSERAVTRQELRDDWRRYWPELAEAAQAPGVAPDAEKRPAHAQLEQQPTTQPRESEPSEAPAAVEPDEEGQPHTPIALGVDLRTRDREDEEVRIARAKRRAEKPGREGPGARDERARYGHPGASRREPKPN